MAWSFVGGATNTAEGAFPQTVTKSVTTGNLLLVGVSSTVGVGEALSISDGVNTWTAISGNIAGIGTSRWWVAVAATTASITVTATDRSGNTATASRSYSVVYPFGGFEAPIVYPGSNTARAGDAVHVRFSLSGDRGLGVVTAAAWAPCVGGDSTSARTTLSYKKDLYDLKAFTSDTWAGSCLDLVLALDDGTTHRVRFGFTR